MNKIEQLMPLTTTGVVPVSKDYLRQYAEAIILECIRIADESPQSSDIGGSIIEEFGLR